MNQFGELPIRYLARSSASLLSGLIVLVALLLTATVHAQEGRNAVEPEIKIEQGEDATYYEHRVNGVLKEIKVVPKVGPVYYLVPSDGGGWIREEKSQVLVPKWKIFEW